MMPWINTSSSSSSSAEQQQKQHSSCSTTMCHVVLGTPICWSHLNDLAS